MSMEIDSDVSFDEHGMSQIALHCIENVIWVIFFVISYRWYFGFVVVFLQICAC